MSRRVLAIGSIINRNQSDKGAHYVSGIGAVNSSVRRHLYKRATARRSAVVELQAETQNNNQSQSEPVNPNIEQPVLLSSNVAANQIIFTLEINSPSVEYTINGGSNWISSQLFQINGINYFRIDNLTNDQSYTVSARAVNNGNVSAPSNSITATPSGTLRQLLYNANPYDVNIPVGGLIKYVLVGGGGGGGSSYDTGSSGGGGGGMVLQSSFISAGGFMVVKVGNGGTGGRSITNPARTDENGNAGEDTTINVVGTDFSIIAKGGSGGLSTRAGVSGAGGVAANPSTITASGGGSGGYSAGTPQGSGGGGGSGGVGGDSINGAGGIGGQPVMVNLEGTTGTFGRGGDGVANGTSTINGVSASPHSGNGGSGSRAASFFSIAGGNGGSGAAWLYF